MAKSIDRVLKLKSRVEQMKSERDREIGALEQVMKQIREESGCQDLSELERLLHKLEKKNAQEEETIEKEVKHLERQLEDYESQ